MSGKHHLDVMLAYQLEKPAAGRLIDVVVMPKSLFRVEDEER